MEHFILSLLGTARGRVVVAVLALSVGTAFVYIAWPDVRDAWRLDRSRATVDAQVVEARTMTGQHFETIYDVRYRFRIPGLGEWFTRRERGTGRSDLWSSLDQPEWERARASGVLRVVYVPDDPSVNRPASRVGSSKADAWAGLIIGAALSAAASGWISAELILRLLRGRDTAADSAEAGRVRSVE